MDFNIKFDEKTRKALLALIAKSSEEYIRIKVVGNGCGKPAYDIYSNFKGEDDIEVVVNNVRFVIAKQDEKLCSNIEIKFDQDVYNKGFYIRMV